MKRYFWLLIFAFVIQTLEAKTTYIPTYYTQINIEGVDGTCSDSTFRRELNMIATDGRYSITILHDSVTAERVKLIKSMKAAAGWSTAAAVLSGVSTSLNPMRTSWDAVNYMSDLNSMASSSMLHIAAKENAESLQRVPVNIIVENLSDREMVVNDMKRGLTWYVPAHNYIQLNVGNPEVNKFRIAYADCQDQKKDYITIQAANYLEKQTISYEDEQAWFVPKYSTSGNGQNISVGRVGTGIVDAEIKLDHYERVNKVTFEHISYTIDEFKNLKKAIKEENKKKK